MSINDEILRVTGGPTVNDGLATFFSKTATETVQDAEQRFLIAEVGAVGQSINDLWYTWLRSQAFTGALNDMKLAYWKSKASAP